MKRIGLVIAACIIAIASISTEALLTRGQQQEPVVPRSGAGISSAPPVTVNPIAYDAKLLALANLQPRTDCAEPKAQNSGSVPSVRIRPVAAISQPAAYVTRKTTMLRPCPAPLWPARAVRPEAGAMLPFKRIVAYYGNFYSARMGVLGEYPPDKVISMLASVATQWAKADPSTPVVPALDYIAVSAQNVPARDGMYRLRMPPAQIEKAIRLADRIQGLAFLDVQPGWSTVEAEVPRLEPYLKQPNVELALDPEFALSDGKRPGAYIGVLNADDINFATRFLARIVRENHLPPKILVVHRFTERMVADFRAIKPLPEVEIVMDMDGFGAPALKVSTYRSYIARQPVQFTGFKLFYKNDLKIGGRLMTPTEILQLSPQPSYILYQ